MPAIPNLKKLRQEDHVFEAGLANIASFKPTRVTHSETLSQKKIA
jgi:hypothetical protein